METSEGKNPKNAVADFETAIINTGYGKYNYLLALIALPGMFSSVLCSAAISYVLPAAQCDLQMTNFDKGALNAVSYAGLIPGAVFWGFLSDNIGRRRTLITAYLLDGIFSLISSLAQSLWFLQLFRFAVGFANSGPYGILITYLLEFHSNEQRSRILMTTTVFVTLTFIVVPGFAWLIIPQPWSWYLFGGTVKYNAWNAFIAVCSLPSLTAGFMLFFFKETPKYLMSRGQNDEAMEVFKYVYSFNTGKNPDTYPIKELIDESFNSSSTTEVSKNSSLNFLKTGLRQVKPLFTKAHLPNVLLVYSIKLFSHFGLNTLRLWMPQIFSLMQEFLNNPNIDSSLSVSLCTMITYNKSADATDVLQANATAAVECTVYVSDSWIYISAMIVGATSAGCALIAHVLINALGKRTMLISTFFLAGLCGLSVYWSRSSSVTTALFSLYQAFLEISFGCVIGMAVEIFPTTVRSVAVSLAMMFGRVGSLTGNLIFPILLDLNCEVPFFLTSAAILGCSLMSWLFPAAKKPVLK